ncbi:AraC family transcriptional regulator [uncultured Pedobacter sp.]|uniref:helix-turn-helix domain-containing protein n=1 Tax=uncultured Pedobacter sp. TaxID=246139 RepID=UPI00260B2210|nr:AraC family transcriptional regulator [uncultured Pedobacter sp.]
MKSVWDHITLIHDYINEHLQEPLSINELAKKFNLSPSTMRKQFYRQYQISLYKFIQKKRMERAVELLKSGKYSIAEVGSEIGFYEPANFTHAFLKYYGFLPKNVFSPSKKDSGSNEV